MFNELLSRVGLSPNEARCYACLLRNGEQSAAQISKLTGIGRTNVYHLISTLETRRLVERTGHAKRSRFRLANPESLEFALDAEEKSIRETRLLLRSELPRLMMSYALIDNKNGVYRFEGKEGLVRVYEELIKDRVTVNSVMNRTQLREAIADYNPIYIKQRIRARIRSRVICTETKKLETPDALQLREVRYLDPKKLPFTMDFKVTSKKVVLTTLSGNEIVGIILNDKEIVKNFGALFEFLWAVAEK